MVMIKKYVNFEIIQEKSKDITVDPVLRKSNHVDMLKLSKI